MIEDDFDMDLTPTPKDYIAGSIPDKLYINPAAKKGAYAQLIDETKEVVIDELEINPRVRLAISIFYATDKQDFSTFKLTKLQYHKTHDWSIDGEIKINGFQLNKLKEFISIISSLNLSDVKKTRLSLDALNIDTLNAVLGTEKGADFLQKLAASPELTKDVFALAHKKEALAVFEKLLNEYDTYKDIYIKENKLKKNGEEDIWQHFFEHNAWIFGHGLNYVFLGNEQGKLEKTTTGSTYNNAGNRVDGLMHTQAVMSQHVLIEIKKPSTELLGKKEYRSGCWAASTELAGAVSQIQKTVFDFVSNQSFKIQVKGSDGKTTGNEIYRVSPKSYLVIGNLSQLKDHDEKFICFQLFRGSTNNPEILTYDELYERAKCIINTLSDTGE